MGAGAGHELDPVGGADQLADHIDYVVPDADPAEGEVAHDLVQHHEVGVARVGRVCGEVVVHLDKALLQEGAPVRGLDAESRGHEEPVEHIEEASFTPEDSTDEDCEKGRVDPVASNFSQHH